MDNQKKQKIMIAVLAVFVVGMGTYWFGFRGTGTQSTQQTVQVSKGRKVRDDLKKTPDKRDRRKRATARDEVKQTTERKTRQMRTRSSSGRRSRRGPARQEKKKKMSPAA